jgi:peptide deformylase
MTGNVRPVVIAGHPALHRAAELVTSFDDDLAQLIEDMFATMYVAQGVGLAAVQVGVSQSVFVYDCPDEVGEQHKGHLVNPVLVWTADELDDSDEGCLSVPGPYASVPRPVAATVRGVDRTGVPVEVSGTGYFARCLLHETEHLQGTLYIDHLNRRRRSRVLQAIEPNTWNAEPTWA